MMNTNTSNARPVAAYRARLRELYGSGRFRVTAAGVVSVKTAQVGGWVMLGRLGDAPLERHLFADAAPEVMADVPQGATVGGAGTGEGSSATSLAEAAYALRVRGDSMHPAIRNGSFVVAEPGRACVPGEYVVLVRRSGETLVKELVAESPDAVVVESVNGGHRLTLDRHDIEKMHPVAAIVSARTWFSVQEDCQ